MDLVASCKEQLAYFHLSLSAILFSLYVRFAVKTSKGVRLFSELASKPTREASHQSV